MSVTHNGQRLLAVLQERLKTTSPSSPVVKQTMTRIGLQISAMAKVIARKMGIYDRGSLVNSIGYELFTEGSKAGVRVGSFGVKYAAMNEYGGPVSPRQMRAMFASMSRRGGPPRKGKNVVKGDGIRGGTWRARPFLRTAVKHNRQYVINTLRNMIREGEGQ